MTVLIFIYVFLSFLNIFLTSSCEMKVQHSCIILVCFMQLLWTNFVISDALCVKTTFDIRILIAKMQDQINTR